MRLLLFSLYHSHDRITVDTAVFINGVTLVSVLPVNPNSVQMIETIFIKSSHNKDHM